MQRGVFTIVIVCFVVSIDSMQVCCWSSTAGERWRRIRQVWSSLCSHGNERVSSATGRSSEVHCPCRQQVSDIAL